MAAEAGSLAAQNEYGLLFAQGLGVPLDYVKAYAWIDMPASAGDHQALKKMAQLLQIMSPAVTQHAKAQAKEYASRFSVRS